VAIAQIVFKVVDASPPSFRDKKLINNRMNALPDRAREQEEPQMSDSPRCLPNAGDDATARHVAEDDAADTKLAENRARTTRELTAATNPNDVAGAEHFARIALIFRLGQFRFVEFECSQLTFVLNAFCSRGHKI